ncbi:MAG: YihY/virulence factor BrkB family protein [Actinomycetes bacterium]
MTEQRSTPAVERSSAPEVPPRGRGGAARRLTTRTLRNAWNDDIFSESAAAAFWQTLSLPPLLLGLFAALGYVDGLFGPETATAVEEWVLEVAGSLFSQQALDEIVRPTVEEVLTAAAGGIVSVGFLITLWSGSSAMAAFVDAITRAHDQYEVRNLVWQRVLSILIYLVGLVTGIIAIPLVTLGPDLLIPLLPDEWEAVTGTVVEFLYYPAVGVVLLLA